MIRSSIAYLVPVAFTVLGFGSIQSVAAQTTYTFNATYNVSSTARAIAPNVSFTSISGESNDAPYNLTKVSGSTYSQVDFSTGSFGFNTNPATFGLSDLPVGEVMLFGSGNNKLFGTNNATGVLDFTTLTGTATNIFTIAGGEGLFTGARGTLTLSEIYQLSLDTTIPTTGISRASGTIEVSSIQIPESNNPTTLIAILMIGAAFLLKKGTGAKGKSIFYDKSA